MTGALALVAALTISSQLQTHPTGLPSVGPSRANSLRTAPIMDKLYEQAGKPALDFDFARYKDLHDNASGATSLVNFSRSAAQSPGTYVGSDGLIHTAAVNLALYSEQFDTWTNYNSTDEANQVTAPDGKQTADIVRETASSTGHSVYRTYTMDSRPKTLSAYIKKSSGTHNVGLGFYSSNAVKFAFNPETGAGVGSFGTEAVQYGSEDVGNGWFRVWVSGIVASGAGGYAIYSIDGTTESFAGNTGNSFLVWGAQLEETDPATMAPTAYIKTTSQALAAPRFDHTPTTGNVTTNLIRYSEFQTAWSSANITKTLQAATDPFGGTQATKLAATAAGGTSFYQAYLAGVIGEKYRWSVYAKALDSNFLRMGVYDSSFGWANLTDIDLSNGTSPDGATISDVGNGWYRVEILTTALNASGAVPYFFVTSDISGSAATGGESVLLYGAQFEQTEASAGPYVRTLSETRSISDANAESLGLLVEEARANATTDSEVVNGYASKTAGGLLTNVGFVGLFKNSGVHIDYDGATSSYVYSPGGIAGQPAVVSFFVIMDDDAGPPLIGYGSSNDLIPVVGGNGVTTDVGVEDYGNRMYRVWAYRSSVTTPNNNGVLKQGTNSSRTFTVSGFQVENNVTFPTSYIPTEGSSQTRYADVAAVQDEDFSTTNLLSYSESFDVGWNRTRINGIVSNDTTSPFGDSRADLIKPSIGSGSSNIDIAPSGTGQTLSVYAKQSGVRWLYLAGPISSDAAWFDLLNGVVGTKQVGVGSSHIEPLGDGWYRCSITTTSAGAGGIAFGFSDADNSTTVVGDGTSGIYLWGASLTATEYPVDYVTTRNLLTDSQDFERGAWTKYSSGTGVAPTIVGDSEQAPDGTNTASEITFSAPASGDQSFLRAYPTVVTGVQYTGSFYVKGEGANVGKTILFRHVAKSSFESIVLTGDWQRIERTETAFSTSQAFEIGLRPGINGTPTDTVTAILWGAQLEPGTTPSDYVRTVDVVGKDYQWYEPTEGTVLSAHNIDTTSGNRIPVAFSDGTTSNQIYLGAGNGFSGLTITLGGAPQVGLFKAATAPADTNILHVAGFAYNDSAYRTNIGSMALEATASGSIPNVNKMYIGGYNVSGVFSGHIRRLTYWPRRQADSTLQVITQ